MGKELVCRNLTYPSETTIILHVEITVSYGNFCKSHGELHFPKGFFRSLWEVCISQKELCGNLQFLMQRAMISYGILKFHMGFEAFPAVSLAVSKSKSMSFVRYGDRDIEVKGPSLLN